jgi:hypothetical protein
LAWPQLQKSAKCSRKVAITGFSCYNVTPLPENCCSTSLFTTVYKRLPEGAQEIDWLAACEGWKLLPGQLRRGLLLLPRLAVCKAAAAAATAAAAGRLCVCESEDGDFKREHGTVQF